MTAHMLAPVQKRYQDLSVKTWNAVPVETKQIQEWIDKGLQKIDRYAMGEEWRIYSGDTCVSMRKRAYGIEVFVFQIKNYELIKKEAWGASDYDGSAW